MREGFWVFIEILIFGNSLFKKMQLFTVCLCFTKIVREIEDKFVLQSEAHTKGYLIY